MADGVITVSGGELHGGSAVIPGDMIEAGSYIVAGLITGGDISVLNCPVCDMKSIFDLLKDFGARLEIGSDVVKTRLGERLNPLTVIASPYPGFPTDLQPIFAPLLAAFSGGCIIDKVWQTRFGYLNSLSNFGVVYNLDNASAVILPSKIKFAKTTSSDLRGGMACLLAALLAEGESEIYSAELILRGYEDLDKKLCSLGADIKIENT